MVVVPETSGLLEAYHSLAGPMLERAGAGRAESKTLGELRDLLLPKLLSGELRVSDAEQALAEAV